jgi:hypothetical protein
MLPPERMAVAVDEAKFMPRREPGEPVYEEARKGLLDLGRMAQHDVSMIEAARLRLDRLDEDARRTPEPRNRLASFLSAPTSARD